MSLVAAGLMNKPGLTPFLVSEIIKIHRGHLMKKMAADSLADLVRIAEELGVRDMNATRYGNSCSSLYTALSDQVAG
jgi:hypothetical protein